MTQAISGNTDGIFGDMLTSVLNFSDVITALRSTKCPDSKVTQAELLRSGFSSNIPEEVFKLKFSLCTRNVKIKYSYIFLLHNVRLR